ncbi:serine/threonine-protein phosphatase 1 regulatory subunit 10 isoform X1 [Hypanus sabinus]|uniref:serine/threonine-protein phosphatase 1 regulatory subunit 10 isoform X1 n=1 Tax=Hypanus sabinus TaxID=79690 RepID=UPI0028C40AF6|nr:serine/threonine-protein phosphatase 1 regulatory subunit 10 isoform X1 [Hypanus sabinus]XP_059826842.1 serine/threonine-protein phosphatase 1 regulatory subunit 10 isoform X1 [Hypanus sabinus]XP_059826843.1 serine/threonine-protein phosphatase 1 regulatory subunit 10 isoform X1 [Hypanus sabinus]
MGSGPVDPKELLIGLDCLLGKDGEIKSADGVTRIYRLMKESKKLVSRCMYLNILLQTRSEEILNQFISIGGYKLLNNWLTYSKTTGNVPLLQQILLALQLLPLTVDHLKQNNTAKIVKQLSKSYEDEELRKLAQVLVDHWMTVIRSQSLGPGMMEKQPERKKRKEEKKDEGKIRAPVSERVPEPKSDLRVETKEEETEKKREKPKSLRTTAPSHAKFRSTGLEMEPAAPIQPKKITPGPVISDKYNIKPAPLKRPNTSLTSSVAPQVEKKYKPLNVTPNATKEIKVKIIPPQPIESTGFLEALNSAPVHGLKIKKKKKITSPTSVKSNPFDPKASPEQNSTKPASPEAAISEPMDVERSATPVPLEEVPEPVEMTTAEEDNSATVAPPATETSVPEAVPEAAKLTKKGKKRKTVSWREESKLREYFYFELDETERVNVNKIKDFGEAAKREMMMDRQAFETARRLSHDTMEEKIPWTCPVLIDLGPQLAERGSNSQEKLIQEEREKGILQEIFLSKDCVPESPHEPDPESYETIPPKVIPLDDENGVEEPMYEEQLQTIPGAQSPDGSGSSKLPPVLANLMGSMGVKTQQAGSNSSSSINVQELLTSIMSNKKPIEELVKQPEFSDKIKQLLGPLQQQAPSGPQMMGPPPAMNGFPPGPNNMPHFPPGGPGGPGGPFPGPHGPRMMGPPQRDGYWDQPNDMRGPPHGMRGGPYQRGRGRSNEPVFRGRCGRGPPHGGGRGGHGNGMGGGHGGADMSNRPPCRHFMMKGSCRYESNCAFYHPGVNGPPLP